MIEQLIAIRRWATLVAFVALTALCGWLYVGKVGVERDFAHYKMEVAEATLEAEKLARQVEQGGQTQVARIIVNEESKRKVLSDRLARADAVNRGLRDEVARLNARPVPEDAAAAAYAGEARVARELLGTCSQRYTEVARDADELRDQVTGLQAFATQVCRAAVSQ